VGIGATSPVSPLHVASDLPSGQWGRMARFYDPTMAPDDSFLIHLGQSDSQNNAGEIGFYYAGAGSPNNRLVLGNYGDAQTMVITAGGNVGIGTTTPTNKLDIAGVARTGTHDTGNGLYVTADGDATAGIAEFRHSNGTQGISVGYAGISTISAAALQLGVNNSTKVTIQNNGNVGIGTTAPLTKLHVSGAISLGISGVNDFYANNIEPTLYYSGAAGSAYPFLEAGNLVIQSRTSTGIARDIVFATGSNAPLTRMIINSTGNVGIGTTSPGSLLHLYTTSAGTGLKVERGGGTESYAQLEISGVSTSGVGYPANLLSRRDLTLSAGQAEVMRITSAGNVGIGTTAPEELLNVYKSQDAMTRLLVQNPNATGTSAGSVVEAKSNESRVSLQAFGGAYTAAGAHFTDRAALWVADGSGLDIVSNPGAGGQDIRFYTAGYATTNERLRITSAGNVGIGTTSPLGPLSVVPTAGKMFTMAADQYANPTWFSGDASSDQSTGMNFQVGSLGSLSNAKGSGFSMYGNIQDPSGYAGSIIFNGATGLTNPTNGSINFRPGSGTINMAILRTGGVSIGSAYNTTDAGNGNLIISGNVGIGTTAPLGRLHSYESGAKTAANYSGYLENIATNADTDSINKYGLYITSTGVFTGSGGGATNNYGIYLNTAAGADANYDIYAASGANLTTAGIWTNAPSYRRYKDNFTETSSYLDKLMELDLYEWQYKDEEVEGANRFAMDSNRHSSPFLDEFYEAFHLGTDKGVNVQDLAGVALASVKELNTRFLEMNQRFDIASQIGTAENLSVDSIISSSSFWEAIKVKIVAWFEGAQIKMAGLFVKDLKIEKSGDALQDTIGTAAIATGTDSVIIKNSKITKESRIFVTWLGDIGQARWWICDKTENESFKVCLSKQVLEEARFDYWIVGVESTADDESQITNQENEIDEIENSEPEIVEPESEVAEPENLNSETQNMGNETIPDDQPPIIDEEEEVEEIAEEEVMEEHGSSQDGN
ncbi:MAG: tail fiber domain-containing protein, partial [bacterium]